MKTEDLVSPEMKQHAQDLKSHAKEGVQNIRQDVTNLAQDARDHAQNSVNAVKDEAFKRVNDAKDKANDLVESVKAYAAENPMRVFVAGLLIGFFLARRHHRHI